ncbi:MAG: ATP-binding protein [Nitrospirae bacterium]|nr:ATP-binding protein [Nitrospirota bacterium]
MRIKEFEYHDKAIGWKLERTTFSELTLLVGISGVGKTEILKAIETVKNIAIGAMFMVWGVEWDIVFSTNDDNEYRWIGDFRKHNLYSEILYWNGEKIIERDGKNILFKGEKIPKLQLGVSTIYTLQEEDDISPVYKNFKKIYAHNKIENYEMILDEQLESLLKIEYNKLEEIINYEIPIITKFLLVSKHFTKIFDEIKGLFIDLFPSVENIRVRSEIGKTDTSIIYMLSFQIKERGVDNWIPMDRISDGMLKTLYLICEMFLQPEGTVNLIDEFENSLGINCISVLGESLSSERKMQYIITSHHPYVINNIGKEHWKVVTRKGGTVTTHDADILLNTKSHHEAFMRLMNLPEYKDGIVNS